MSYKSIADWMEDNNKKDSVTEANFWSGPTPPPNPKDGDYWFNTLTNHLYVYAV